MRGVAVGVAGLTLTMFLAGCQSGANSPTPSGSPSAATSGTELSLLVICPEVSKLMGMVSASPSQDEAGKIASQLEALSSRGDASAQKALKPMIDGMKRAAAMGYSAEEFRPSAASFGEACRAASQTPKSG